jgi:hypothetical protein
MNGLTLYTKISKLPNPAKGKLLEYMESLIKGQASSKFKKHPKAGCMKGTFVMAEDFDVPLDDFKEYME